MYQYQFHLNEVLDQSHNSLLILVYHMSYVRLELISLKVSSIIHMTHLLDQHHNIIYFLEIIYKHRNLNVLDCTCNIRILLDLFCISHSLNDFFIMSNNLQILDELYKHYNLGEYHWLCSIHEILGLLCTHHNFCGWDFNDNIIRILDHSYIYHSFYPLDLICNIVMSLDFIYINRNLNVQRYSYSILLSQGIYCKSHNLNEMDFCHNIFQILV